MKRRLAFTLGAAVALAGAAGYAYQNRAVRPHPGHAAVVAEHPGPAVVVPEGTPVTIRLEDRLDAASSRVGEGFRAAVAAGVPVGNEVVIPEGAAVSGHVIVAEAPESLDGHAKLQLRYDELAIGRDRYRLDTHGMMYESAWGARRGAGTIRGGAGAGRLVGGPAPSAASKPDLEFAPGTLLRVRLDRALSIRVRPV